MTAELERDVDLETERWLHHRSLIGQLGCGMESVVQSSSDAERLGFALAFEVGCGPKWRGLYDAG